MRKNIQKVIQAFKDGKAIQGDSKRTCWTDGRNLYSYNMLLAKRFDNGSKDMIVVISEEYSPSRTTTAQIRAIISECDNAQIVREGSILTWDFKFNSSY